MMENNFLHSFSLCFWPAGYVDLIFNEVIQQRKNFKTLDAAKLHSQEVLPTEPRSLVDKYLAGKERPSKEQVVANRHTRYSSPALVIENIENGNVSCSCKGMCATRACKCKEKELDCGSKCTCKESKCKNREV